MEIGSVLNPPGQEGYNAKDSLFQERTNSTQIQKQVASDSKTQSSKNLDFAIGHHTNLIK